jgi:hypothetical protein
LFDGVGKALHYIAGFATDEQLDLLNHKVEQLTSTDRKVTTMLQDQLTYFRNSESREKEQRVAINQLGSGLSAISQSGPLYKHFIRSSENIKPASSCSGDNQLGYVFISSKSLSHRC